MPPFTPCSHHRGESLRNMTPYSPLIPFNPPGLKFRIRHEDRIFLLGSCFTENMAQRLSEAGFRIVTNPHGILFGPESIYLALNRYLNPRPYKPEDLFHYQEAWHSWDHHSQFSHAHQLEALNAMNDSLEQGTRGLLAADWIIITLGTAFQYYLREKNYPVSNNHRCPMPWFDRRMVSIPRIIETLSLSIVRIREQNPRANLLFTISPVRHLREGVMENNRSKARLLESVHHVCEQFDAVHYFPAYEWQMDVLRDYRYYDLDRVHPNFEASEFIWAQFQDWAMDLRCRQIVEQMQDIARARRHSPRLPHSRNHRDFALQYLEKVQSLQRRYPHLDLQQEEEYFRAQAEGG